MIASGIRRERNLGKINRIMKQEGLPEEIRKDVKAEYRDFTKSISLSSILGNTNFRTIVKEDRKKEEAEIST